MQQSGLQRTKNHWEELFVEGIIGAGQTAEDLWKAAIKYFKWCDDNPIYRSEMLRSGKDAGKILQLPIQRPYNVSALCLRIGISQAYLYDAAQSQEQNDYYFVANQILQICYAQRLEGALVGIYNPIIAGKELGLGDTSTTSKSSPIIKIEVETNAPKLLSSETEIEIPNQEK